jgi:hypothetical protein
MIPRAKIEKFSKAPPENILNIPNKVPAFWEKNADRASPFIPGVGICTPILYTASMISVNKTRLRSSGIFAALCNPLIINTYLQYSSI